MAGTFNRIPIAQNDEGARLAARLIASLPAATFEMETLCKLAGISATRAIPTAAVECVQRPRLLLNPDFVGKYCMRDEHLFLLVMHELWHILMAHTRVYPRMTPAQNIAFDAIINASLIRQFRKPEYSGFFDAINPSDKFPHLLLRPPEGWPNHPIYPTGVGPQGTTRILHQLYPAPDDVFTPMPFYEEILDLLRQYVRENGGEIWVIEGEPVLLGDHDTPDTKKGILASEFFNSIIKDVVDKWPSKPYLGRRRGDGRLLGDRQVQFGQSPEQTRRAFARVLRRCLGPRLGRERRKNRTEIPGITGISVLPNARDRLAPARRLLGGPDTLWSQPGVVQARVRERPSKAHIYIDVSGSMSRLIPHLLSLILPYVARHEAEVFQFSTAVEELTLAKLREGRLRTTGGTNINCVLQHVLDIKPRVRRLLVLTDGYTGHPQPTHISKLSERNMRVHVVLPHESSCEDELRDLAASITVLPPLNVGHRF